MLYNEYRPKRLKNLLGQEVIVKTLGNKLASGEVPHSMLFIGVRGTGKTTTARVVAKSLNCEAPVNGEPCCCCKNCLAIDNESSFDVQEMDAAANRGVEDMNRLLDSIGTVPLMKKKVYIIDEVHMLTKEASNRLLKVLEEPPANVHFILCTTELLKVLPTIRSRCSMFNFKGIDDVTIATELSRICDEKSIAYDLEALYIVAKAARSSMRDALSLMEPLISEGDKITCDLAYEMLGIMDDSVVSELLTSVFEKDVAGVQDTLEGMIATGRGIDLILESLLNLLNDLLLVRLSGNTDSITNTAVYKEKVAELAEKTDEAEIMELFEEIKKVRGVMAKDSNSKLSLLCVFLSHIYREKRTDEVACLRKEIDNLRGKVEELMISIANAASTEVGNRSMMHETGVVTQSEHAQIDELEEEDVEEDMCEEYMDNYIEEFINAEPQAQVCQEKAEERVPENKNPLSGYFNMMKGVMAGNFSNNSSVSTPVGVNSTDGFVPLGARETIPFDSTESIPERKAVDSNQDVSQSPMDDMPEEMKAVFMNSGLKTGAVVTIQGGNDAKAENTAQPVSTPVVTVEDRKETISREVNVGKSGNTVSESVKETVPKEEKKEENKQENIEEKGADVVSMSAMSSFLSNFNFFGK